METKALELTEAEVKFLLSELWENALNDTGPADSYRDSRKRWRENTSRKLERLQCLFLGIDYNEAMAGIVIHATPSQYIGEWQEVKDE